MAENIQPIEDLNKKSARLISLDAFRGFTIALMIVVNDPGSWQHVYSPLRHATWNGWTPTDLVFPFFLYIVGVSIALAYTKRLQAGVSKKGMYKKILSRSLKIFAVGMFLRLFPDFDFTDMRWAGVLQRIAIVFGVGAVLFLNTNWKQQVKVAAAILIAYWIIMVFIPVPGVGKPDLSEPMNNWANYLDSLILPGKMYKGTWDPEGILSTFPAIVTAITGMLAGRLILYDKISQDRRIVWLFGLGFLSYVLGSAWGYVFPINKALWTSSFVLLTSGLASMALAASIFFIDVLGYKKRTRIGIIFGANAITIYALSGLLPDLFFARWFGGESLNSLFFSGLVSVGFAPKLVSFMYAIGYTLVCFIPAYFMYKKKIFIKV